MGIPLTNMRKAFGAKPGIAAPMSVRASSRPSLEQQTDSSV